MNNFFYTQIIEKVFFSATFYLNAVLCVFRSKLGFFFTNFCIIDYEERMHNKAKLIEKIQRTLYKIVVKMKIVKKNVSNSYEKYFRFYMIFIKKNTSIIFNKNPMYSLSMKPDFNVLLKLLKIPGKLENKKHISRNTYPENFSIFQKARAASHERKFFDFFFHGNSGFYIKMKVDIFFMKFIKKYLKKKTNLIVHHKLMNFILNF